VRLAQEYLNAGESVRIFSPFHVNAYLPSLPNAFVEGKHLSRFPQKTTLFFSLYNRLASRNAIRKWQPSIVHETYYARHGSAPKNCPTVITVHDMIHELFVQEFPARDKTSDIKKISINRADHVICISESTKKDLIQLHGISSNKITVVLHGFDQFTATNQETQASNHPINAKPFLLYVGSRGGYKNFARFLRTVAASPKLKSDFDVIAFGGGKFKGEELSLIASRGFAANQVKQINGDDALLGYYYSTASAFVYPSLYEGFGIPPLEAMAHGCPVVSSNTSSMPEVVGQAGELFNPTSTDEMQNAIESVVYSNSRITELKALGTARLALFSWSKCAEQTRAVYRTLL
jgi:glycosyltransferase involved in cell wall biosynthesis